MVIPSRVTDGGPFDPAILFLEIHPKGRLAKISGEVGTRQQQKTRNNPNVHPYSDSAATKSKGRKEGEKGKKEENLHILLWNSLFLDILSNNKKICVYMYI